MAQNYDLIVIGAGTAARVAAMRVRKAGKSVAVIDSRPYGGTCALRGCDPKKMLRNGAAVVDDVRRMHGKGVIGDAGIDSRPRVGGRLETERGVLDAQGSHFLLHVLCD